MIKFFRQIRQNLLMENKTGKYFKYAIGEIILVVIGILIALQINNWNEDRLNRQKERIYLTEIKNGLKSDLNEEFIPAVRIYGQRLEDVKKIEAFYNNTETFSIDSLTVYFRSFLRPEWDFVFNMAAFENLKSTGIDIITNDSIRSQISSLYSYRYPNIREVNQNYIRYYDLQVSPLIYTNVNSTTHNLAPGELAFFKNNIHFVNTLNLIKRRRRFLYHRLLIPVKKEIESLIKDIELELEKLK